MASTWLILVRSSTLAVVDKITSDELAQTQGSLMLGQASACPSCGGSAVRSLAVACAGTQANECKLVAILPPKGGAESFCLRNTNSSCSRLANANVNVISLPDAGHWLEPGSQTVLGLRKKHSSEFSEEHHESNQAQLRDRRRRRSRAMSAAQDSIWEAYRLSLDGELQTVDVPAEAEAGFEEAALYVNEAGPIVALNTQAVAVAFGNTVKVVRSVRRGSVGRSALATTPGRTSLDLRNT
ncbi:hypothetical protein K431DRAFT_232860 [Polychaeton citri CBS 116435]|uniref:Uncharacterized protein n=1 Tax=Polychaeton citri CBS 116435 TaxID=1314669 RepID=A0A9P4UJ40_9PEZI|nr:hypothetical protein K431DRAFT_232860 [Polychaeton citri CBS 116435]